MFGLGTIINGSAIVVGGVIGLLIGNKMSERFQNILINTLGLSIMFMSIADVIKQMFVITDNTITTQGTYILIFSLCVGALIGEAANIEDKMEHFGEWLKKKTRRSGDHQFVDAFVTASLTVCVGAMAVLGSIKDGVSGDYSVLLTKAILDLVIIVLMTSSMGIGAAFSAIPVVIFQGTITILARFLAPYLTDAAISNLSLVGGILVFCVGYNITFGKKFKVANMLPAIFLAIAIALM